MLQVTVALPCRASSRFNTKMTDLVRCTDIDAAELMYYSHFVIERDTQFKKKELHSS